MANQREKMNEALRETYWRGKGTQQQVLLEFVAREDQTVFSRYQLDKREMEGPLEYCLHGGSTQLPAVELSFRVPGHQRWDHLAWIYINEEGDLVVSRGLEVHMFEKIDKRLFIDLLVETWWNETAPTLT